MGILVKTAVIMAGVSVLLVGVTFNILRAQDLGPRNTGNRTMVSEARTVTAAVVIVKLDSGVDLILRQGAVPAISARAEQRLLGNLVTRQEGNTLTISTKGVMINSRKPMRVELTLPALQELHVEGSGDSKVDGFSGEAIVLAAKGSGNIRFNGQYRRLVGAISGSGDLRYESGDIDSVELTMQGSGDATVSGTATTLKAALSGSGDLLASQLKAKNVTVGITGSGEAMVHATDSADIAITGSGDVRVAGSPTRRTINKTGSGDVSWE
jgi:hypothetical protein